MFLRDSKAIKLFLCVYFTWATQTTEVAKAADGCSVTAIRVADAEVKDWGEFGGKTSGAYPLSFTLPIDRNAVTFELKQIDVNSETKIGDLYEYRFLLEGVDKQWSPPTTFPKLSYVNLPAGAYTLSIRARKPGMKSFVEESEQVTFSVSEPFWRKNLVWAPLLALAVGAAAFLAGKRSGGGAPPVQKGSPLEESLARTENLESRLQTAEKELQAAYADAKRAEAELGTLKNQIEALDVNFKAVSLQNDQLLNQKTTMDEQALRLQAELERAQNHIADLQAQIVMAEKLSLLGELTASIAHDMGSPITVVKNSIHESLTQLPSIFRFLPDFWNKLPGEARPLFLQTLDALFQNTGPIPSNVERRHIAELRKELIIASIDDAEDFADTPVKAGLYDHTALITQLLQSVPKPEIVVDALSKIGRVWRQTNNIARSSERAEKLLNMVKGYARKEGEVSRPTPTDVVDTLEQVIALNEPLFRKGVEVETDFPENPPILPGYPDELMQVWANIVSNAIYAMKGKGKLLFGVKEVGANVVITIKDSGPGMPPEKLEKIFQLGYTDKAKGEGTGLGLAICKRVVAKHHGGIRVESSVQRADSEGYTMFTIELPRV